MQPINESGERAELASQDFSSALIPLLLSSHRAIKKPTAIVAAATEFLLVLLPSLGNYR